MRSFLFQSLLSLTLLSLAFRIAPTQLGNAGDMEYEEREARMEWERKRLCDPATGKIPEHMRELELQFAKNLPTRESMQGSHRLLSNNWLPTGPYNIGGRTRAVAMDVRNENTILAGQVSGGVWKSTNGGASWRRTSAPNEMLYVSCLTQDTRPGKQDIWYAGTGEFWGNSSQVNGTGIYKSTDAGESWVSLKATYNSTPESWDNGFEFVWRIVVDHTNTTQDVVYAATALGAINRSSDGGQSWKTTLGAFANGYGYFTEVAISPSGKLYATISQQTSQTGSSTVKGIYRSADGLQWTNISPSFLPSVFGRIAIGIAPSDEQHVYFIANTTGTGFRSVDFRGREEWNSLWKYQYLSGDGTGTGGKWEDRSQNLPRMGGFFGDYQSQGSYDLHVRVHPTQPNVVFVGGTNLYRSDDGFTSPTWNWCGGYAPGTGFPFYELYPNNHPDQHDLIFYPSNPDKALCACDGGVFRSDNVRAGTVQWSSLNNGYQCTQFYTCALDRAKKNSVMIGGLQDNGTVFTNAVDPMKDWTSPGRGDGSYCAIADDGTYYLSSQQGTLGRFELDSAGNVKRYARIDPAGVIRDNYLFINPFCLNPTNNKQMVLPYYRSIVRFTDLSAAAWGTWQKDPTNTLGWDTLPIPPSTKVISAVALSKAPANRLYYGTDDGFLFRVDDCMAASVNQKNITGSSFPRGNIECIAVNPHNADSLLVVFSNYRMQSLFFSSDGGTSWQTVGGNLEGAINGVGNGPSCRWACFTFVNGKPLVYVGTSVGLYCTALLNSTNTVWVQEGASSIGNAVVSMMDYRESDNFMAVATHGAGMFAGTVQDLPPAPEVPVLESPNDKVRGVLGSQNVKWKASLNANTYSVQVSTTPDFTSVASNLDAIKTLSALLDNLAQGRKDHYWRVRAYGAGGMSAYSEARVFTTAIEAPTLLLPEAGANGQPIDPILSWTQVNGAKSYHLQVSTSIGFGSPVADTIISASEFQLHNLAAAKRYFWRVLSIDADGAGMFSDNRTFVTSGSNSVRDNTLCSHLQCVPSPVKDVLSLRFTMPRAERVQAVVLDNSGRQVLELFHQNLSAGDQELRKDCSLLPNGVYIVRLSSPSGYQSLSIVVQH